MNGELSSFSHSLAVLLYCCLQASLADFWMFEHLVSLPSAIASEEIISHIGAQFPYRESENITMPAAVQARMFLQRMRAGGPDSLSDLLQLLGALQQASSMQHQFHSRAAARSIAPPAELVTEVGGYC
jgi:hypothetical protein